MELIAKAKIQPYIPFLQFICVVAGLLATGLLLFKSLYFHTWEEKWETIVYSIPMVFLLFVWAASKLDEKLSWHIEIIAIDGLVVFLAAARVLGLFFHSGHVLFLLYTYLTTTNKTYRFFCTLMALVTAWFKILGRLYLSYCCFSYGLFSIGI